MGLPRITFLILCLGLAACSSRGDDIVLKRIKDKGNGPNEFTILPTKPLQSPDDFNALPTPAPGTVNLVDPRPKEDGAAALGGNPAAMQGTAPAASDGGLVRHANRFGATAGIRQQVRQEDIETRRKRGRVNLIRIGNSDDYTDAYKNQWLDASREERRLRQRGIQTPSAPPEKD